MFKHFRPWMLYESDEEEETDEIERAYYRTIAKEFQMKLKKFLQSSRNEREEEEEEKV